LDHYKQACESIRTLRIISNIFFGLQQIKDATPAILVAISMFIFPANFHQFLPTSKNDSKSKSDIKRLLNWRVVQSNITWGVVFLLGGGFALAYGIQVGVIAVILLSI